MELYHGTNLIIEKPKLLPSTHPMDFGGGFYTTTNYGQAESFARRVVRFRGHTPIVNIYGFDFDDANFSNYKILQFEKPDAEWLHFVISNRRMEYEDMGHELIIGPVANDDVYETITALENGIYDEEEALKRLKVKELFNQYVFKTQKIMDDLVFKESKNVR